MSPANITPERVRSFLIQRYSAQIQIKVPNPSDIPDSFDLLLEGIVDSFGFLELVGELEKEFGLELDMSGMEAEQMTVVGPLALHVASQAKAGGQA